jgi:hypothetical protein
MIKDKFFLKCMIGWAIPDLNIYILKGDIVEVLSTDNETVIEVYNGIMRGYQVGFSADLMVKHFERLTNSDELELIMKSK